jgi:GAF domain-containing protein
VSEERQPTYDELKAQLAEALEQQTAMAEVLKVIASAPTDLSGVLDTIARTVVNLCAADDGRVSLSDDGILRAAGNFNRPGVLADWIGRRGPESGYSSLVALRERRPVQLYGDPADYEEEYRLAAQANRDQGIGAVLSVPLLRADEAIGLIQVRRTQPVAFTQEQVALVEAFADQAAIAIDNARLLRELRERNREVTEALDQQTAVAGVLEAISSAPTDLQRVFGVIVESTVRLAGVVSASLFRVDRDEVTGLATYPEASRALRMTLASYTSSPDFLEAARGLVTVNAVHTPEEYEQLGNRSSAELARARGWTSTAAQHVVIDDRADATQH